MRSIRSLLVGFTVVGLFATCSAEQTAFTPSTSSGYQGSAASTVVTRYSVPRAGQSPLPAESAARVSPEVACPPPQICNPPQPSNNPKPTPRPTSPIVGYANVDVRNYMAATTGTANGGGNMLCDAAEDNPTCLYSFLDASGEDQLSYGNKNGIVDWIGISTGQEAPFGNVPENYIGVIRNIPGAGGQLRCFALPNSPCSAPAKDVEMPEGMPYVMQSLAEVNYATELQAENADGSPSFPINGSQITSTYPGNSGGDSFSYAENSMSGGCSQTFVRNYTTTDYVVYVKSIPFGGSIGTQSDPVGDNRIL